MSRAAFKRSYDVFDSSPISSSSTPLQPPTKRYHIDSDASSDTFAFHLPSDSPSNPFGRFKPFVPRGLPRATPVSDHLILRFQLAAQASNVHRIVSVPPNFTFWHLSRLTQFLFGWKDVRTERSPYNKYERIKRHIEHVFTIQKRVSFYSNNSRHVGVIKSGETVVRVAGNIKGLKSRCNDGITWEREECYTLQHLWHRPGTSSELSRAIIYDYDVLSSRKELVYISIYSDSEKLKAQQHDLDDSCNLPYVLIGQGLPNDDDDEEFALDLQQWNEPLAFENYILSQEKDEEESDDDGPSPARLAEEQARVKLRMTAPLPSRLPIDDEEGEVEEEEEEEASVTFKVLNKEAEAPRAFPKKRQSLPRLPDPDESREVGVGYPEEHDERPKAFAKRRAPVAHMPDPDESREIGAHHNPGPREVLAPRREQSPVKKRVVARLPDPDESREVGVSYPSDRKRIHLPDPDESREIDGWSDGDERNARVTLDTRVHALRKKPAAPYHPVKQVPTRGGGRRVVLGALAEEEEAGDSEAEL
ncbi:hypothetical protein DFH11DRAFT_1584701 [Phellopilus nigrolimitatus]|nr:hypothetical protein DFH11DRAFT_1584701 [Phellopilus nigrolimitatus]